MKYYLVKVKQMIETEKGVKNQISQFLTKAESVVEAERKTMEQFTITDTEVIEVKESKIVDIFI